MLAAMRIGLLLFPRCMPAGLFAFADLLHAANRRSGRGLFEADYVALQAGPVECAHGVTLQATASLAERELDALLIPGFWAESAQQVDEVLAGHAPLIRELSTGSRRLQLWSYCTGVGLLAASGRLDGQPATVTWWLAETLRQRFPRVHWQSEQNCVFNANTATASGVNGYLPIAQALIERSVSAEVVRDLTRLMVLPRPVVPHPAFQGMSLMEQAGTLLRQLHALVERLPAEQITVAVLANRLGMSERTLARKVLGETGQAVASYARRIKLNQVSERLMLTAASVTTISAELGFSSDSNMRRMYKELTGLTPAEYRQRFGRL
ncbi:MULTISPECIES: helix-turn-helix domain-containing protein [unclassified Pseudomonas]|uniref:GlxA family transcriptional regulator n=1 Tax=unclassified Pseudomonas TaxID=196821 RepID=UPI00244D7463|nr:MULTISPECIES: helix-turn-helix domain-containing protein [unclassified Pseudomonas]MDG9924382.1 helix-turn-helix domain-containing protein [Pseudomonas sp. GD04045]MDH0033423.1 helix-turn-helix domain-containing protein [Pseudomonas sp. GD04019]